MADATETPRVRGYVVLASYDLGTTEPVRFVIGAAEAPALGELPPLFAEWHDAHDAGNALEARGFTFGGVAPVVAINDDRLPA